MRDNLIESWRNAPRLTSFSSFFDATAAGASGAPDLDIPQADLALLEFDLDCRIFWDSHRRLWGHFDRHYFASIPFRLEEEVRLGAALLSQLLATWASHDRPATFYSLGAGTGCLARTLAKLGDGRLKTLCCSPTEANRTSFEAMRGSDHAVFFHGPFFELSDERLRDEEALGPFRAGFDILFEDTTFQMYGPDRDNQLAFIAPRIRPGGLLIQVEKMNLSDPQAYAARERQKDQSFKARFFSQAEIDKKKEDVVDLMSDLQVDLDDHVTALRSFFRYVVLTWNSGNFYTIVSSNSRSSLSQFLARLVPPAIPPAFCYEVLPRVLVGDRLDAQTQSLTWFDGPFPALKNQFRPGAPLQG